jgi:DNA polymerase
MDRSENVYPKISQLIENIKLRVELEDFFADDFHLSTAEKIQSCSDLTSFSPKSKKVVIKTLYDQVLNCKLCELHKSRKNVVFGEGSLDARLVFVGEAPGRDEDLQGRPFVGMAGSLLTKIINAMHLNRKEVFITNVLRCRPPDNRNPLPEEVVCCKPYLIKLLDTIKPSIICTLGKFAAHALLDVDTPISRLRGRFYEFQGIKLMPTYHPAYLLRNPLDKKLVWEDMKKIMKILNKNET